MSRSPAPLPKYPSVCARFLPNGLGGECAPAFMTRAAHVWGEPPDFSDNTVVHTKKTRSFLHDASIRFQNDTVEGVSIRIQLERGGSKIRSALWEKWIRACWFPADGYKFCIIYYSIFISTSRQGGINGLIKLTGRGATIVCFHCEEKQRYYSCKRLRDCPSIRYLITDGASEASVFTMQFRTVLDVKVVDVEKRRNPSKHYVSWLPIHLASFSNLMLRYRKTHLDNDKEHFCNVINTSTILFRPLKKSAGT